MRLDLTDAQKALAARIDAWLPGALEGHRADWPDAADEDRAFAAEIAWERTLHDAGWAAMHWPEAYGGRGLGIVEHHLVMRALGAAMAPEGANNIGRELAGPIILARGTEAQKRRFLPRIAACAEVWCQGFSETEAGSDLAALRTRAVRDGDGWRIDGHKVWTSYARHAQWCLLIARTDGSAKPHAGLTLFLVPMDAPGLAVTPIRQITGKHTFNEVALDGVTVGDDLRLGPVDAGWDVAMGVLAFERGTTRLYRQARFAAELREMARLLGPDAEPERIGRLHARLSVLEAQNWRIVSRVAAGERIGAEASLQKLAWSELHMDMLREAQALAGPAFLTDPDWAPLRHAYLQAQAETVYAGSSEVQRGIIADRILHLPRPPRPTPSEARA